jgi:SagB-type dehydrogenase family enzyme
VEPLENDDSREQQFRIRAAYLNGFKDYSLWVNSTGVRTHQLTYKNLALGSGDNLGDDFLANTRLQKCDKGTPLSIAQYFDEIGTVLMELQHEPNGRTETQLPLPPSPPLDLSLGRTLENRRSTREYTGDPITLDSLAALLRCAGGITAKLTFNDYGGNPRTLSMRTVPSGGGLYPVDIMVIPTNVTGLSRGLYRYIPSMDSIAIQRLDWSDEEIRSAFNFPEEFISFKRAAAIVFFVATPWKSMRKYGNRGMRYVLHECGSMALALHLGATALGIATTDCASFFDNDLNELLGLDGVSSAIAHSIFVGYGRT